jgi:hypothetical protein
VYHFVPGVSYLAVLRLKKVCRMIYVLNQTYYLFCINFYTASTFAILSHLCVLLQATVTFISKLLKIFAANLVWKHNNESQLMCYHHWCRLCVVICQKYWLSDRCANMCVVLLQATSSRWTRSLTGRSRMVCSGGLGARYVCSIDLSCSFG